MEEAIATFAVEKLGDLIVNELIIKAAKHLYGVKGEVKKLQTELTRMHTFLQAVAQRKEGNIEDKSVRNYIVEIQGVAYEAEDLIETYILKVESRRGVGVVNALRRFSSILGEGFTLWKLGSEIKAINIKISDITSSLPRYGINLNQEAAQGSNSRLIDLRRSYSHVEEDDIVGLDNDADQLVFELVTRKKHVAIWGMGGLGKTTLAKKIYQHCQIYRHFDRLSWTCISQQWNTKDVLRELLIDLESPSKEKREEIYGMEVKELAKQLYQFQKNSKCLVVLDDVWSAEALQSISSAFPRTMSRSKILLTTRNKDVASQVSTHMGQESVLHELRFLNEEESWDLFHRKALSRRDATDFQLYNTEMGTIGREIVGRCKGLPLAIVVLGGILATKKTIQQWETVRRDLTSYLSGKQSVDVMQMLDLSYLDLPYYLKPCFLYLGQYPEDSQIRTESLVRKWVAEGIVSSRHHNQHNGANISMVDVAKRYLDELAERCMVQLQFTKVRQRVKSCRLHDLVREFCLSKLGDHEDFLKVFCFRPTSSSSPTSSSIDTTSRIRRLAISVDPASSSIGTFCEENYRQMTSTGVYHHVRSILLPNVKEFSGRVKIIFKSFDFLRVLDFEGILLQVNNGDRKKLPKEIGKLMHLRYLSLRRSAFRKLPSSIGNLRCLETLDLRCKSVEALYMPNVLCKLENLRHLYLPDEMEISGMLLRLDTLKNLETLVNFKDKYCDVKRMPQLSNLRELKGMEIRAEHLGITLKSLSSCVSSLQYSSFSVVGDIEKEEQQGQMRQLLACQHLHKLHMYGSLKKLPEYKQLSPNIISLSLENTELEEDPMPTLEKLPHLKFLELWASSYVGKELVCSAPQSISSEVDLLNSCNNNNNLGGFPQLRDLVVYGLSNLEEWKVEEGAMPSLCSILIFGCRKLKEIPTGLESITTLETLRVLDMPDKFMRKVEEDKLYKKLQH